MENIVIDLLIRVLVVIGLVVSGAGPAEHDPAPVEEAADQTDR